MTSPDSNAAEGASTLIELLNAARDNGFTEQFIAQEDGTVRCAGCDRHVDAERLVVHAESRLEGASDAADEMLVLSVECAECDARGTLTLGYGPNASAADVAVMERLDQDADDH